MEVLANHRREQLTTRHVETVMAIPMSVDIRSSLLDPEQTARAVADAFAILHADDARFSTFRPDSEVSRINAGVQSVSMASPELAEVRAIAAAAERASGGAFSERDPAGRLNLNGVVKGWSAQRAAERMSAAGLTAFCLNAGGDVVVRGGPEPGRLWHVGVRSPLAEVPLAVLAVTDAGVATSGTYERGMHLWDTRRAGRRDGTELAGVTVVAESLTTADVLATTVFVLGVDGVTWAAERYDCAVLAVDPAGRLFSAGPVGALLARPGMLVR